MGTLAEAARETFDVLVVGGGIIGAGIARDAALRGLRVALFEQADFGGGTTAGSTRLVHGGLRYLEMLDFGLVRMDLREREALLRIAPHLVRPLEFLLPLYSRSLYYRAKLAMGMLLYDLLSFDKTLPRRRWLSREAVLREEPGLASRHLQGAAAYHDAQVALPERLCLENVIDACDLGAAVFNYTEAVQALHADGRVTGLRVRDVLSGEHAEVRGRVVVNAAGPWFDRVAARLAPAAPARLRTTKGVHLACPRASRRALVLFSRVDGRLFFAIPWLGYTWLGTTDTDFGEDPRAASATPEDAEYLLRSVRDYLPAIDPAHVSFSNAGVRALVFEGGSESSISRQHRIVDEAASGMQGLVSVLGGKITGFRAIAEEATDVVCRRLGVSARCGTAARPLPGARPAPAAPASTNGFSRETLEHLAWLYGSRAADVVRLAAAEPTLAEPLASNAPDVAAQAVFSVRNEHCVRLSDFLLRRTRLGFSADQGQAALPRATAVLARELGWDEARREAERAAYLAAVAQSQSFRATAAGSAEGRADARSSSAGKAVG